MCSPGELFFTFFTLFTASMDIQVKSIASLKRGLAVLKVLQEEESVAFADLHRATGIPRASLLRILKTMADGGWIQRDAVSGLYTTEPAPEPQQPEPDWRKQLSQLSQPIRRALERKIPWPVNIAVRDQTQMVILDTKSGCSLTPNYHALSFRPEMLETAVGRCYLAFCPNDEREDILQKLARRARGRTQFLLIGETVRSALARVRTQGYALHSAADIAPQSPRRYGALAVPLHHRGKLMASMAFVWLPTVQSEAQVTAAYLPHLRDAALAIELKWGGLGNKPRNFHHH
jgi:IclR family transcriptional regulator, mhp operon transcriptional activator